MVSPRKTTRRAFLYGGSAVQAITDLIPDETLAGPTRQSIAAPPAPPAPASYLPPVRPPPSGRARGGGAVMQNFGAPATLMLLAAAHVLAFALMVRNAPNCMSYSARSVPDSSLVGPVRTISETGE